MRKKIICLLIPSILILSINCTAMGELNASIETGGTGTRINLTEEGSADWAYWTRLSLEPENSKAGADDIGPLTTIGSLGLQDNTSLTGWDVEFSDGSNPVSGTSDNLGNRVRISSSPDQDEGYRLTVKSGMEPRVLKLYIHNRETPSIIRAILGNEILETLVPYRETGAMGDCSYTLEFSHPTARELTVEYFCPAGASPTYTLRLAVATLSGELVLRHLNAYDSSPDDGQTDVYRDTILSWSPGQYADKHDVYFGTDFDNVSNADSDNPLDTLVSSGQSFNTYEPGRLEFDHSYYWRIDEVNAPSSPGIYKGDIWSFTTEPLAYTIPGDMIYAIASGQAAPDQGPENTINGSGLVDDLHSNDLADMWLSAPGEPNSAWIKYEFDKVYILHEMWVWNYNAPSFLAALGLKDVTIEYSIDDINWTQLDNNIQFETAPGQNGYAYNTTVAFIDIPVKYVMITANSNQAGGGFFNQYGLSEVRFFNIPVQARNPQPPNGQVDVGLDTVLSWRPGRQAVVHDVYFSSDADSIINDTAPADTIDQSSYAVGPLDLGTMYYWRVDEVNEVTWQGDMWSFSTYEYIDVEDFEDYNDIEPDTVYLAWTDGWDNPSNGSTIGYPNPDFLAGEHYMETRIRHGGVQSAPVLYDNSSATYSEVTIATDILTIGRDWTEGNPQMLSLWFYGNTENSNTEQMYVKLNNTAKVTYNADLTQEAWQQLTVNLSDFGINFSNVTQLGIGFERTGASGGTGIVFIDDIQLYTSLDN